MGEAASKLTKIINRAVQAGETTLTTRAPVKTGRLKASVRRTGKVRIRETDPRRGRGQRIDSQVVVSGNTDYMQYVTRYHRAVDAALRSVNNSLRGRRFRVRYTIRRGRRRRGRRSGGAILAAVAFAARRHPIGRAAFSFSARRRLSPYNSRRDEYVDITVHFRVSDLVQVESDGVRITIRYPGTLVPRY